MYWYCVCPICDGQGRLVIKKDIEKNKLFFHCDECESSWESASDIGNGHRVFLGYKIKSSYATENDIKNFGWEKYKKNVYIK
ncbi:hypothetical protein [Proteus mirabilis]|uniref:hypothetical protein n=1 Tax=Proteus mirabilis TaxID=584 RepID=UPI0018C630B9|nr:hypothetical protein [Proteus mirabilis]EKT9732339.1 hypothetical protein [Proteus mirabilis]EKU2831049.1 hypothetical protein [Proteus mirabilis]EKU7916727.1 hypothetical protein [Proteus mirabilis]EKU8688754.1 hypothetical protein [Proteus mirabilis]EKU8701800.1 hypothetical protein [Proteus mirabilis]